MAGSSGLPTKGLRPGRDVIVCAAPYPLVTGVVTFVTFGSAKISAQSALGEFEDLGSAPSDTGGSETATPGRDALGSCVVRGWPFGGGRWQPLTAVTSASVLPTTGHLLKLQSPPCLLEYAPDIRS